MKVGQAKSCGGGLTSSCASETAAGGRRTGSDPNWPGGGPAGLAWPGWTGCSYLSAVKDTRCVLCIRRSFPAPRVCLSPSGLCGWTINTLAPHPPFLALTNEKLTAASSIGVAHRLLSGLNTYPRRSQRLLKRRPLKKCSLAWTRRCARRAYVRAAWRRVARWTRMP